MSEHLFTMLPQHPPIPDTCKICGYTTKLKGNLERHCVSVHHIASLVNICKYCGNNPLPVFSKNSQAESLPTAEIPADSEDSSEHKLYFDNSKNQDDGGDNEYISCVDVKGEHFLFKKTIFAEDIIDSSSDFDSDNESDTESNTSDGYDADDEYSSDDESHVDDTKSL